jgi:DNA polymerase-3 subunit delta'
MERANAGFSNKILKTLEEPPASVILLLTAEDRSQLLPTIVSRCQVVDLRPLAVAEVRRMLGQQRGLDATMADLLARYANGKPGWAMKERHDQLAQLWALLRSDLLMRLQLSESLAAAKGSKRLFALLSVWQTWWRDLMLVQVGVPSECTNQDALPELTLEADLISREDVGRYLGLISRAEEQLHRTVNVRLALDVLLLRLPRLPKDLPVAA